MNLKCFALFLFALSLSLNSWGAPPTLRSSGEYPYNSLSPVNSAGDARSTGLAYAFTTYENTLSMPAEVTISASKLEHQYPPDFPNATSYVQEVVGKWTLQPGQKINLYKQDGLFCTYQFFNMSWHCMGNSSGSVYSEYISGVMGAPQPSGPTASITCKGVTANAGETKTVYANVGETVTFSTNGSGDAGTFTGIWGYNITAPPFTLSKSVTVGAGGAGASMYTWTNSPNKTAQATIGVVVNPPSVPAPTGSITADSTSMTVGQSTTLRSHATMGAGDTLTGHSIDSPSEGTTYSWGGTNADYNVTFTPSAAGTYTFYNRINTSNHSWGTYGSVTITVSAAPVNQFPSIAYQSGATTVYPGDSVAITFRGTDPEGGVDAILIDLNGTPNRHDPISPARSPADLSNYPFAAGAVGTTYTIAARAKDNWGQISSFATVTVTVVGRPATYSVNGPFTYDGSSKTATITANPVSTTYTTGGTLTATNAGTYTATATGTGAYLGANNNSLSWTISKAPQTVTLAPATSTVALGSTINFTASGGSSTGVYTWGGAASGTGAAKSYQFNSLGTYTITVYKTGDANYLDSNTATATVTVSTTPATFTIPPTSYVYNGAPKTLPITSVVSNPVGATFAFGGDTSGTAPGTYVATATPTGAYSGPASNLSWTITPAVAGSVKATSAPAAGYDKWFTPSAPVDVPVNINP